MAIPFPSDAWIKEYQTRLNENETYQEAADGWGVGFNGDFIFHVQADDRLPEDRFFFLGLEDGDVYDCREIESPDEVDAGFTIRGDYSDWIRLNEGEVGAVDGMMSGVFDIEGDMQKVLQYSQAAVAMTETSHGIETDYEF
ncbi:SCP2 sterol-binding domain-containing protein [Natronomonas sp. EA1]|uniref:SCP2 sterol-binding domain-containing protein n=1 Tax=Natronomonas sp. EA1 TaxID=3421655 RepID=UPI003EBAFDA1